MIFLVAYLEILGKILGENGTGNNGTIKIAQAIMAQVIRAQMENRKKMAH